MPDRRLTVCVRPLPGIERQVRLRFSRHQAPTERGHIVFLGIGENALERVIAIARQEFGAE